MKIIMVSKISYKKFSLGYSISSFLITFGAITLYKSVTTNLFLIGAHIIDLFSYLIFISVFTFILALLAPLFGFLSDKKKTSSRRAPYLIIRCFPHYFGGSMCSSEERWLIEKSW